MKKSVYNYRSIDSNSILYINKSFVGFFAVLIYTGISKNAIKGQLDSILFLTLPRIVYHFRKSQ